VFAGAGFLAGLGMIAALIGSIRMVFRQKPRAGANKA